MALIRISPIVPYNVTNYFMGTTKIKFVHYLVGSLPMLAMNAFTIYLAASLEDISSVVRG